MKRGFSLNVLFLVIFTILLMNLVVADENTTNNQTNKTGKQLKCESYNGTWKTFSNACVDSCAIAKNSDLVCAYVLTESCDCGSDKCWDDDKCKINPKPKNKTNDNEDDDNETDDDEDCWSCSKWSFCLNYTRTRTCTPIANCTNDDDDDEDNNKTPKTTKKCDLKRAIKHYYASDDCPAECTCSGSTIKCQLASGRIMTVYAGKSGNIIVQIKGVNISTNVTLYKNENGTIEGIFKGNKTKIIKLMPDEIKEKIKEKIKAKLEKEEIELDENGIYKIKANKKSRLFLIIPVSENIEGEVDSESGNIIIIKKGSWWGFLAKDVSED